MFGINSFHQVKEIAEGHWNEFTGKEKDLSERRLAICAECPLRSETVLGPICDANKCWDTINEKVVSYPGKNIICGCQCRLQAKTSLKNAKCVLGKW